MPACGDITGLWDQSEVNIGWYGYRCTSPANIRSGPGAGFPIRGPVQSEKRLGWQSVRNPNALDLPYPRAIRRADDGSDWVWVYMIDGGLTGWFPLTHLEYYDTGSPWARGPAGVDFHVKEEPCPGKGKEEGCRGSTTGGSTRRVRPSVEDVYLRYAPQSTAFHFLHGGDTFKDLYHSPLGYRGVEVINAPGVPNGTRGWVIETAIE